MCIAVIKATSLLLVEEEQDSAIVTAAAEAISASLHVLWEIGNV
jgi:hypothetical protein